MRPPRRVYLVDDDASFLRALTRLLRLCGYEVHPFSSAQSLLDSDALRERGCVIADLQLPGCSGLELQKELLALDRPVPIVFLTGRGDIPTTVRAIRAGAIDFLTKPVEQEQLIDALERALRWEAEQHQLSARRAILRDRLESLTPRERQVIQHVIAGKTNRETAEDLGTGERNIKAHRARIMKKFGVQSLPELVIAAQSLGLLPARRRIADS